MRVEKPPLIGPYKQANRPYRPLQTSKPPLNIKNQTASEPPNASHNPLPKFYSKNFIILYAKFLFSFVSMGLFTALFKKDIDREVNKRTSVFQQQLQQSLTNLYNRNVYQYLFKDQIILKEDDYDYAREAYAAVGAAYECVDLIVKKIIACPRIVYRVKDEKELKKYYAKSMSPDTMPQAMIAKAKALEEVSHAEIEKLLYEPNPKFNGDDTMEMFAGMYLLNGNSYLYGNAGSQAKIDAQKWTEIWAVPGSMDIKSGGMMEAITSYVMRNWSQETPFPAKQIKHIKTFNPLYTGNGQELYGLSALRAYIYALDTYKNAERQSDRQVKSGGAIGLLTPENKEDAFGTEQLDDIDEQLKRAHESDDELARLVPLSVGIKYTKVGLSSQEMELLQTKDAKADDIYRGYHVPLQFRSQDTATYNNLPVANRQLIYNAVCPPLRKIEKALTEFICTPYNTAKEKFIIVLDYTALPELNDDMKTVAEWLEKCDDLTPNEKREVKGWGRSAEEGMDFVWVNKNKVRMADIVAGKINQNGTDTTPPPAQGV